MAGMESESGMFRNGEGLTQEEEQELASLLRDAVAVRGLFTRVVEGRTPKRIAAHPMPSKGVSRHRVSRHFSPLRIVRPDGIEQFLELSDTTTTVRVKDIGATNVLWGCAYLLREGVGRKAEVVDDVTMPVLMQVRFDDGSHSDWHFAQFGNGLGQMDDMSRDVYELAMYRFAAVLPPASV
jgi:hypothetical protein